MWPTLYSVHMAKSHGECILYFFFFLKKSKYLLVMQREKTNLQWMLVNFSGLHGSTQKYLRVLWLFGTLLLSHLFLRSTKIHNEKLHAMRVVNLSKNNEKDSVTVRYCQNGKCKLTGVSNLVAEAFTKVEACVIVVPSSLHI